MTPTVTSGTDLAPFAVEVPETVLDDLRARLARTRWPAAIPGAGWRSGADLDHIRDLCEYWRSEFDWRAAEARINAWPQFTTVVDGPQVHVVHARSPHPDARALLLTHGWPSCASEFLDVIGPLTDPTAHGGDAADAFHVIAPSIPGYGWSGPVTEPGWHVGRVVDAFVTLVDRLGYDRFAVHGGDWGSPISNGIARTVPDRVIGLHVTMLVSAGLQPDDGEPTPQESDLAAAQEAYNATEQGYLVLNATKPDTVAFGLADSPAGLAAWIVEKLRTWTDHDGDHETVFNRDAVLTLLTTWWVTNTAASAGRLYYESGLAGRLGPPAGRTEVPTGVAVFPKELYRASRRVAEHHYAVEQWTELPRGGHFPAVEQPSLLIDALQDFFRGRR